MLYNGCQMQGYSENFSSSNDTELKYNSANEKSNVGEQKSNSTKKNPNSFSEIIKFLLIAVLIVAPIRFFIAEPYIVNGASMSPTFESADYLIVDKVSYKLGEPERGDVVIFRFPGDTSKFFIKRIIALPHETVRVRKGEVFITNSESPEGFKIEEEYIKNHSFESLERSLSDDEYFVMGDNRSASSDSRSWGVLSRDLITGKAFIRLLPVTKAGLYPGEANF